MKVVIDTDVLIALVKMRKLEDFLIRYEPYITVITLYEYMRGEVAAGVDAQESKSTLGGPSIFFPLIIILSK
ncbi:MAG: hypothetical protein ACTSUJ_07240 [Candidatus Njordarchaeales archaeon]